MEKESVHVNAEWIKKNYVSYINFFFQKPTRHRVPSLKSNKIQSTNI